MVTIDTNCPFCGAHNTVEASESGLRQWQAGANIQDAFPNMSADDRELLKTGICTPCWDKSFG